MVRVKLLPGGHIHNRPKLPPCEERVKAEWRGRNKRLKDKCGNFAQIEIDGKKYCVRHAQAKALEILLETKELPKT